MLLKTGTALALIVSMVSAALSAGDQVRDPPRTQDERGVNIGSKPPVLINRPSFICTETGKRC
jgi:hypothetical protein